MTRAAQGASSSLDLLTAASGADQTLSTAIIGLFTLMSTVAVMYLIARGSGNRD